MPDVINQNTLNVVTINAYYAYLLGLNKGKLYYIVLYCINSGMLIPAAWVGEAHLVLKGHRSIVNQVRFNPSNHLFLSSGVEKVIKVRYHSTILGFQYVYICSLMIQVILFTIYVDMCVTCQSEIFLYSVPYCNMQYKIDNTCCKNLKIVFRINCKKNACLKNYDYHLSDDDRDEARIYCNSC